MKQILITLILSLLFTNAFASGECKEGEVGTSSCSGKCTLCLNTSTQDLRVVKNSDVGVNEDVIMSLNGYGQIYSLGQANNWDINKGIRNVTIGEGITGSDDWSLSSYFYPTGCSTCTLTLPSTFKDSFHNNPHYHQIFQNTKFGTIDLSALHDVDITLNQDVSMNIILGEDSNSRITIAGSYTSGSPQVSVQCKGTDLKACSDQIIYNKRNTAVSSEYYQQTDEKGRIQQWSKDGLFIYQYAPNGDYTLFDENENVLGHFKADGTKRRIYTVDEATAVTGGKNTFSIKYR